MSSTIDYATRPPPPRYQSAYRYAIILGAIPMALGTLIFLLWLIIRADAFEALGFFNILLGCVLVLAGSVNLAMFAFGEIRAGAARENNFRRRVTLAALMLFGNFPLALSYVLLADALARAVTVHVHNSGSVPVNAVLCSPGGRDESDVIEPGETRRMRVNISGEGSLSLQLNRGGTQSETILNGYVPAPSGSPHEYDVVVANEKIDVKDLSGR